MMAIPYKVTVVAGPPCTCGALRIRVQDGPDGSCHARMLTEDEARELRDALNTVLAEAAKAIRSPREPGEKP